jgi:hypothetical protein
VTAPKHFHGQNLDRSLGVFEYMCYEFSIRRPKAIADRPAILAAFRDEHLTYIDNSEVSATDLEGWIPTKAGELKKGMERERSVPLGSEIQGRRKRKRDHLIVRHAFVVARNPPYVLRIHYPTANDVPGTPEERRTEFENKLRDEPEYGPPFPIYERWGYLSLTEFLEGFVWKFTKRGKVLTVTGRRVVYTIIVAITERRADANGVSQDTGNVMFNYHPNTGLANNREIVNMAESNPDYFATV